MIFRWVTQLIKKSLEKLLTTTIVVGCLAWHGERADWIMDNNYCATASYGRADFVWVGTVDRYGIVRSRSSSIIVAAKIDPLCHQEFCSAD